MLSIDGYTVNPTELKFCMENRTASTPGSLGSKLYFVPIPFPAGSREIKEWFWRSVPLKQRIFGLFQIK